MLPSQREISLNYPEGIYSLSRPKVGPVQIRREGTSSEKVNSIPISSRSALIGKQTAKKREIGLKYK